MQPESECLVATSTDTSCKVSSTRRQHVRLHVCKNNKFIKPCACDGLDFNNHVLDRVQSSCVWSKMVAQAHLGGQPETLPAEETGRGICWLLDAIDDLSKISEFVGEYLTQHSEPPTLLVSARNALQCASRPQRPHLRARSRACATLVLNRVTALSAARTSSVRGDCSQVRSEDARPAPPACFVSAGGRGLPTRSLLSTHSCPQGLVQLLPTQAAARRWPLHWLQLRLSEGLFQD